MDDVTQAAIDHLKSNGYAVFERVPNFAELSLEDLHKWRVKLNAWNTDVSHQTSIYIDEIWRVIDSRTTSEDD